MEEKYKELPEEIKTYLERIKSEHGEESPYYEDKLEFCMKIYVHNNTYDEVWKNVSRTQCLRMRMRCRQLIQEPLLGNDKYNAVVDLVESARETI